MIFTNSNFISSSGVGNINISDHEIIFCTRKKIKSKHTSVSFQGRSYRNVDSERFIANFENCNWDEFENSNDAETLWKFYENNLLSVLDSMCPLKIFNIANDRDPWISDDLINEINKKIIY